MNDPARALDVPDALRVVDASHDPAAVAAATELPDLADAEFRRLGTVWFATAPGADTAVDATCAVYVSRYGDALAYADPVDPAVRLRVVSVLQSGVIVETVVQPSTSGVYRSPVASPRAEPAPAPPPPPPPEPPAASASLPPDEVLGLGGDEEEARTSRELLDELGIEVQGDRWTRDTKRVPARTPTPEPVPAPAPRPAARVRPAPAPPAAVGAVDRWLADLDGTGRSVRHPSHTESGVFRQVVDADDAATVWVAHRGFLRRVQGQDDEVVDHGSIDLLRAAVRRLEHVRLAQPGGGGPSVGRVVDVMQNLLLAAPALLALVNGMVWWGAAIVGALTAALGLGTVHLLRTPALRRWAALVPVGVALFGALTMSWLGALFLLGYGVAVVLSREPWLRPLAVRVLARSSGTPAGGPPIVPMPMLLERYR